MLEDIISETMSLGRVFYLEFPVTIPARESISVAAVLHKQLGYDFACAGTDNIGAQGYNMVTQLGSNLKTTTLCASLVNTQRIKKCAAKLWL